MPYKNKTNGLDLTLTASKSKIKICNKSSALFAGILAITTLLDLGSFHDKLLNVISVSITQ